MGEEWTALDDAVEEVRQIRQLWAEFDNDPFKLAEYLRESEKQFGDRVITSPEQPANLRRDPDETGKSKA